MKQINFIDKIGSLSRHLPKDSCDGHIHIFGDASRFPPRIKTRYDLPSAGIDAALSMLSALNFDRFVIVQPSIYGVDNSLLYSVLNELPTNERRGVCCIDDTVGDDEIVRLHEAGVRGVRFDFRKGSDTAVSFQSFKRTMERVRSLKWFAKIIADACDLAKIQSEFANLDAPILFDHMFLFWRVPPELKLQLKQQIVNFLRNENWWINLSGGHHYAKVSSSLEEAVDFGSMLFQTVPDRCVWGSDWPQVIFRDQMNDTEIKRPTHSYSDCIQNLLMRYAPAEAGLEKILVRNPGILFDF